MFNALADMYHDVEMQGITIFPCPMKGRKAISDVEGFIGIDYGKIENQREEVTALIHEEGHFNSGAFYVPYSPYLVKEQAEYRADKAAALKRVPLAELVEEMRRGFSVWEIAEHFNVEPSFIWRAYTIYRDNLGVNFEALA